ncbi:MAG: LLM class flavin-dependent oxidoreductase [Thalassobaculum sp.]|uniref:LLM class flavin-dependent oxidoreductase n=1 Tax=Thalassobaculum sp. TaxID=2022740 RepID=UPI0032ED5F33
MSFLDPTVVLPVMAAATTHLGLGATLSTSFHTPCHLARWLGSLDVLSGGRVAWNVVTSATDLEARNAGMDALPPREERSMKAEGLTLAEAAARRHRRRELVGTPAQIADRLQGLFEAGVRDGFVLSPTMFPGMFEQFCRAVVPELQRRGIFRKRYTGSTLRENLRG